ncbi:MAG: hypothetical protein RL208_788 [Pseudomonadota bacterium]|jgi:hypothetical protein
MITFLVSIALFHLYNFVINKDDLFSKVLDHRKMKEIEDLIKEIEKEIADLNKDAKDVEADLGNLPKGDAFANSVKNLHKRCSEKLNSINTNIKEYEKRKNEIKNSISLNTNFELGAIMDFVVKYIFTISYIVLLFSYFFAGNITNSNVIFHYASSLLAVNNWLQLPSKISEIFFYICTVIFFIEIYLFVSHSRENNNNVTYSLKMLKKISNDITDTFFELYDLQMFDLSDLKQDLK